MIYSFILIYLTAMILFRIGHNRDLKRHCKDKYFFVNRNINRKKLKISKQFRCEFHYRSKQFIDNFN